MTDKAASPVSCQNPTTSTAECECPNCVKVKAASPVLSLLDGVKAVEVHLDRNSAQERTTWRVWISNGIGGHGWGGRGVAVCYSRGDAELVAAGLRVLMPTASDNTETPAPAMKRVRIGRNWYNLIDEGSDNTDSPS